MASNLSRSLSDLYVGLSVSESDDSASRGFPPWLINTVTLQMTSALMGQGAGVIFGHDWRDDGVMQAVHGFALRMQSNLAPQQSRKPLLQNVLAWPDKPQILDEQTRDRLASTLSIDEAGLPDDLIGRGEVFDDRTREYLRARGLTHLRRKLIALTEARICLGGRLHGSKGRYPGIIEEAFLSIEKRQPLFLIGLLGGATRRVIDVVEGGVQPPDIVPSPRLEQLYTSNRSKGATKDAQIDLDQVWSQFRKLGLKGLSSRNQLSEEENRELFTTPAVDRAIELTLLGLARIKKKNLASGDKAQRPPLDLKETGGKSTRRLPRGRTAQKNKR